MLRALKTFSGHDEIKITEYFKNFLTNVGYIVPKLVEVQILIISYQIFE